MWELVEEISPLGFTSLWPDDEETDIYEAPVCAQDCAGSFPYVISPSPPESDKVCGVGPFTG